MRIFDIKRASVNDGEGIRTVVFFKGCPLRCAWCHNPESFSGGIQLAYIADKCISCGLCVETCEKGCHSVKGGIHGFSSQSCAYCMKCVKACPTEALQQSGYDTTAEKVFVTVQSDSKFFSASGGGLTLSGGEPMAQSSEAILLASMAHEKGIPVFIETSGYGEKADFLKIIPYTDCFLFDIKTVPELYRKYTGQSFDKIRENLFAIDEVGARIILRCPIIPNVNLTKEHFDYIAQLARSLSHVCEIDLEPYHPTGLSKYDRFRMTAGYTGKNYLDKSILLPYRDEVERKSGVATKIM